MSEKTKWVGTWSSSAAAAGIHIPPLIHLNNGLLYSTARSVIRPTLDGDSIRLKISNRYNKISLHKRDHCCKLCGRQGQHRHPRQCDFRWQKRAYSCSRRVNPFRYSELQGRNSETYCGELLCQTRCYAHQEPLRRSHISQPGQLHSQNKVRALVASDIKN